MSDRSWGLHQANVVSVTLLIPALIGFSLGEKLRALLSGERFYKLLLLMFLLMGLNLLRRGIML